MHICRERESVFGRRPLRLCASVVHPPMYIHTSPLLHTPSMALPVVKASTPPLKRPMISSMRSNVEIVVKKRVVRLTTVHACKKRVVLKIGRVGCCSVCVCAHIEYSMSAAYSIRGSNQRSVQPSLLLFRFSLHTTTQRLCSGQARHCHLADAC